MNTIICFQFKVFLKRLVWSATAVNKWANGKEKKKKMKLDVSDAMDGRCCYKYWKEMKLL